MDNVAIPNCDGGRKRPVDVPRLAGSRRESAAALETETIFAMLRIVLTREKNSPSGHFCSFAERPVMMA